MTSTFRETTTSRRRFLTPEHISYQPREIGPDITASTLTPDSENRRSSQQQNREKSASELVYILAAFGREA